MKITEDIISKTPFDDKVELTIKDYHGEPGNQHYKLLAWLSTQFNGQEIFDIGTYEGASSSALSYNKNNKVLSFDINLSKLAMRKPNCEYICQNLWDPEIRNFWKPRILASPLIFLDIDPHEGQREFEFYNWLKDINYQGILLLDDIWYFKPMRDNLWTKISQTKYDLTELGHWSGTGLVDFSGKVEFENKNTDNWTLVTAYFDLTKESDANESINRRPISHYLSTANSTMSVEQNLVVFCEEETKVFLDSLRPEHLKHKTKYIICGFNDFELSHTRDKIIQNRIGNQYYHNNNDNRVTPSYYIFCMLRYVMINKIIEENPFNSSQFAWINICIERMGWRNVAGLKRALSVNREKFSTCYIDYQPKHLVENYSEYFKYGRCSMCSGFFTGSAEYFMKFNNLILATFYDCLEKGYGHADEQLYSIVYFKNPEVFELYYGDYQGMITNYIEVIDKVESPIIHVINNAYKNKNYEICLDGCLHVLPSYNKIPQHLIISFLKFITISSIHMKRMDVLDLIKDKLESRL